MNPHTEWWSTFFSGLILDAQRNMFPPERTRAEADFIVKTLGQAPGARLLEETGFSQIEGFGSTAGEPFQFGSWDCYLVAMRA